MNETPAQNPYPQAPPGSYAAAPPPAGAPGGAVAYAPPPPHGPLGKVRSTGICILLTIVTLGFYAWVWWFKTHSEMKRHSGAGLGGPVALLLAIFVPFVLAYVSSSEVGGLYERRGERKPVSGATGLWYFPGNFILVGPIVWFVKTNGALNTYWRSLGAS